MSNSSRMKRWWKVLLLLAVLVTAGVAGLNWMMSQSLYTVGSVRAEQQLTAPLEPPAQTDEAGWLVEPEIRLAYEAHGTGPAVLVVHGGPGFPYRSAWKGLGTLQDRFCFYYYHQRGCGDSTRPFDRFSDGSFYDNMITLERTLGIGAQIADIERIRRVLGQEQLIVIGHSFGGFIATMYAAEFPERVKKLVLVAPAGVLTAPEGERDLFAQARRRLSAEQQVEFDRVQQEYFDFGSIFSRSDQELRDLHRESGRWLLTAMQEDVEELNSGPSPGGWAVFAMYFSLGRAPDFRPALQRVTAPTLIVHGVDDTISLPGAQMYQAIPDSEFVMIPRDASDAPVRHSVFNDNPSEFARQVKSFLSAEGL